MKKKTFETDIYLNRRYSTKHFSVIIPHGTRDCDLIQIDAKKFNESNENHLSIKEEQSGYNYY